MNQGKSINYAMIFIIVCLAISLSISGCTSQKSKLIGKWQRTGEPATLEFFSDNRVVFSDRLLTTTGDWNILDDGRIKVEFPYGGVIITATGKIQGDILYMTNTDGSVSKYQKLTATTISPGGSYRTVVNGYTLVYEIVNGKVHLNAIETQAGTPVLKISSHDLENKINSLIASGRSSEQAIKEAVQSVKVT